MWNDGFPVPQHKGKQQPQCPWSSSAGPRQVLVGFWASSVLAAQRWDVHMFLHRCPPSSSLVDSLSKASCLARPYVLGHGDSGMWKEQHIILGLQTPSGAIPSKFCRRRDPELPIPHRRARRAIGADFSPHLSKPGSRKPLPFVLSPNQLSLSAP